MAAPIQHHLAGGIHPGAFVQDTAPVTTDVQDGVLWVDTSTDPPYQLKVWDALSETWPAVGSVDGTPTGSAVDSAGNVHTGCLVYPNGATVCNPSADHLNVSSSGFDWRISNTGLTISYGSHLAWTFTPTQLIDAAGMILETVAL